MMRVAFAMIAVALVMPVSLGQKPSEFRAAARGITVDVSVDDGDKPVTNLTSKDFVVLDNDVRQTVSDVDFGTLPIDLRVVFDASSSITNAQFADHARAVRLVSEALTPSDRCEVSQFRRRPTDVVSLRSPPIELSVSRDGLDGTAFFDAAGLAMITVPRLGRRQLTVILSDGDDTASFFDAPTLLDLAQRSDAVVYTMARVSTSHVDRPGLKALADITGGRFITFSADGDLGQAFLKVLEEFRRGYVLHYTATGVDRPGWHALTVSLSGSKHYTIRARKGYDGGS